MKKYTADFESATWIEDETYVWAWAVCEIDNSENVILGNSIDTFMEFCKNSGNSKFWFHNLKFDGEFIIYYLLKNGFKHIEKKGEADNKTFTTLISDMGMFYEITVYFSKKGKKVIKATFLDSLKILPFSVEQIAKSFNLSISKLELDYLKEREKGHILTPEEEDYIKNDVKIVAQALQVVFSEDLQKMTIGANALGNYKKILTARKFEHYYPNLDKEVDKDIRQAYKGGFTYLNPIYKEVDVGAGVVLDVNSLYPSVMYECLLPFGDGVYYEGKYKEDRVYPLYIQMITCRFKLKKNKIPTIQLKNHRYFFGNEYLESSNDEIECLVLTSVDLKLFLEQYEVTDLTFHSGWKFKGIKGLFKEYIDKWITVKNEATLSGNKGRRTLAKLMLNSLYGKFATALTASSKIPLLEDDIVHYEMEEAKDKKGIYLPVACFITAYAREKTIRTSQAIKDYSLKKYGVDMYCYSDTDSIHTTLPREDLTKFCQISDTTLGWWKIESEFTRAKFIRQKCYIEEFNGEINITCAGMPKSCYKYVEWEKFKTGFTCGGKLTYKHVKGGVILTETEFTIREEKMRKQIENF